MSSFDEFYKNSDLFNTYDSEVLMREVYEAGEQSRQAEIDELKKDNEGYRKLVNYDTQEMEKLHNKIDELRSRLKAVNEYQDIIFKELQFVNPNFELVFNKLEDIEDLSKGNQS